MKKPNLLKLVRDSAQDMTEAEKKWPAVAMMDGPTECIEIIVQKASKESGIKMNWGYMGGRAIVCSKGDKTKCRAALHQATPRNNIQPEEYYA